MPATFETKLYDLNVYYEHGYMDQPMVIAYELYKNENGDWETATGDPVFHYYFTQEDIDWVVREFDYDSIADYWIDEWLTTDDNTLLWSNLPPKAIEALKNLPSYMSEDHSEEKRLVNG